MKIKTLHEQYLRGIIDGKIADWDINNCSIDEEKQLSYTLEFGLSGGEKTTDSVKIIFSWVLEGERVFTGDPETPYENKQDDIEDWFIILASDKVSKLLSYVEDTLEKVTG